MEHEERFKENLEEVQRWRRALTQVANLSGWDVKDKPEYAEIGKIIKEGSENLGAIVVRRFPKYDEEIEAMTTLRADALAQMGSLKLLILRSLNFSGSLNFLSSELGYLLWDKYPFTCLPSRFEPDKLVELILRHSNISKLWEGPKALPNLIYIDLSYSRNLIKMPSFLEIPNLERLDLRGCIKLVQIDPSISILRRLSELNLENCTNLVSIPNNIFGLSSLEYLNLSGCQKLLNNKLLKRQRQIENLEMLDKKESTTQYQSTAVTVLKPSFWYWKFFRKQENSVCLLLPSSSRLSCLISLNVSFCNLLEIPNAIGWLHSLERLNLGGNNFVTLPSSIKELSKLRHLNMEHCTQLKHFPELSSKFVLPIRETFCGGYDMKLYIFDCPNLIETDCCYKMAFSWMIQFLKVYMKSDLRIGVIKIVIPRTQIPMWFNKQNAGYHSAPKEGYASIGGGSPLRKITDDQALALKMALEAKGLTSNVYVGMRYWFPFTEEAVQQIKRDGITRLVVLPLYPQFSISTTGSSISVLEQTFREDDYLSRLPVSIINSWYQREGYLKSMADLIEKELQSFSEPMEAMIFFSAHGVPVSYVENAGDPYRDQMEECIFLIMQELKARGISNKHTLAYQSRVGPVQWLKPYTDEVLVELGQKGVKSLLAVPVSFVSEHIETLEEIDMEYRELALESGIKNWARVPALGLTPSFITDLADAVIEALPSAAVIYAPANTSEDMENDPVKFFVKMFFGSVLAFILFLSPKMITAFRNHVS
ncbi:hypothetical protein P8452_31644 [Trifolium repens]|nr:hypothetical protein P8452_31644 [Trifolium repens]